MGWTFHAGATRQDVIADLVKGWDGEEIKCISLSHAVRGNILWCLYETTHKASGKVSTWIGCSILGSDPGYGWGSKDMEESMGPCYYSCPLSFLDRAPQPGNKYSADWRATVRAYHAKLAAGRMNKRTVAVGDTIDNPGYQHIGPMQVEQIILGPKGQRRLIRARAKSGQLYHLTGKYFQGMVIAKAQAAAA